MDWFKKIMAAVGTLANGAGAVVDAAVPVVQGDRTKIAAVIAVATPVLCKALDPIAPGACPVIQSVGSLATMLIPVFAFAGLVRK